jgi:hypothetical protein
MGEGVRSRPGLPHRRPAGLRPRDPVRHRRGAQEGSRSRPVGAPRPLAPGFLPPRKQASQDRGDRSVHSASKKARLPSATGLGAPARPSPSPAVDLSLSRQSVSPSGNRARSSAKTDNRGPDAGRLEQGSRGLYRPAPCATAAVQRGSDSSTIVSGRSKGSAARPAPPPSRPRHPV